jgi:hypothetical protein
MRRLAAFVLEPSAKVYALWERDGEWTDIDDNL